MKEYKIESMVQIKGVKFREDMDDSCGVDLFVIEKNVSKAKELLKICEK